MFGDRSVVADLVGWPLRADYSVELGAHPAIFHYPNRASFCVLNGEEFLNDERQYVILLNSFELDAFSRSERGRRGRRLVRRKQLMTKATVTLRDSSRIEEKREPPSPRNHSSAAPTTY